MSRENDDGNDESGRMTDEERQRTMDFIIQQQAQFSADMQLMREAQAQADEKWERRWESTANGINALLAIAEIHEREINTLAGAQGQMTKAQEQMTKAQAEAQARTDRQMAETDERLNALVNVVEKMISDRRNGN